MDRSVPLMRCRAQCYDCPWRSGGHHNVYVVHSRATGLTKIGQSKNPKRRIQEHRTRYRDAAYLACLPVGCLALTEHFEQAALARLDQRYRVHGDWYALPGEQVAQQVIEWHEGIPLFAASARPWERFYDGQIRAAQQEANERAARDFW